MRSAFPIKTTGVIGPRLALICVPFLTGPLWGQATNVFPSSGSVGIGTTVPAVNLHVQGKTYSSNGFAVAGGDLTSALNGAPWYGLGITNTAMLGSVQAVQLAGWGGLNFQTGGGQVVMKGDNGNVGIGTTA